MASDEKRLHDIAKELAEELFTTGAGTKGERLAIITDGKDHGGWGLSVLTDRIGRALHKAVRDPECEPTQAELAEGLLESANATRDDATKMVVQIITDLEAELKVRRDAD